MPAPMTPAEVTLHTQSGPFFMLVPDARGNPLAHAPFDALPRVPDALEPPHSDLAFLRLTESALKRLYDLAFLCEHPFTRLHIVAARLEARRGGMHCLGRARIVSALLQETIEQLRPNGTLPSRTAIPRREWHAYLVLQCAYVEGEPNVHIMNWLQIGEGTFNRTRRSALQTVAKVLMEMEQAH